MHWLHSKVISGQIPTTGPALRKAQLISLLRYALQHPHSHLWIGAISHLLAKEMD